MARPREFDEGEVIAKAMEAFWSHGYAGASVDELAEATGLNRSSLYNAFGGKLELFCAALDRYRAGPANEVIEPLLSERGATALRRFLARLMKFVESPAACRGCLIVNTAMEPELGPQVRQRVRGHFELLHRCIERSYGEAICDGEVRPKENPDAVAQWLVAFVRGVLVSAASHVDVDEVKNSIRMTRRQLGLA
ncbi:MAG: TetR/AcrR family transcriptional regulator [Myxococcales bacterium]|nr:TetR/AcrR family transcriptional regulator [Myxococcales bacterium]